MNMIELFAQATLEQKEKALSCQTVEELEALAKSENISLSAEDAVKAFSAMHAQMGEMRDEDLDNVAGGKGETMKCPFCGSTNLYVKPTNRPDVKSQWMCKDCGEGTMKKT